MADVDVDFDRAWFALKAHVVKKRSHGADELLVRMSELEVECIARDPEPAPAEHHEPTPLRPREQDEDAVRPAHSAPAA